MAKIIFRCSSAVIEHLPYHPKSMGLILPGSGRDKMAKIIFRGSSAVVEHLPYKSKIMGLIIATASGTGREKMAQWSNTCLITPRLWVRF